MNQEGRDPPDRPPHDGGEGSLPGHVVLIILALIALACIGGYFLVMKLIDISRQEDCMLAGRRNCAAPITEPSSR
jgi:hypothetical protein